jgi:hypothetical protein
LKLDAGDADVVRRGRGNRRRAADGAVSVAGAAGAGSTSQIARLNRSPVGAVSLIETVVPAAAVGAFCFWTQ